MADRFIGPPRLQQRSGWLLLFIVIVVLLLSSRYLAGTFVDYA